jgi:two-component system, response regulator PdtaR
MASSEQHGKPMIVLVEDEPSEREPIARHLQEHGFSVEVVDNSDAALALLKKRTDIRGLVTDAHVPGKIDGFELAALARERWPDLAVVMMSGHSDESSGPIPDGGDFVSKPYLFSHLVPALNRLMGRA